MNIIAGNIIALIGSLLMVYSGIIKDKKKILFVQSIQILLFIISNLVLGGITGAIINLIGFIRNILCYYDKYNNIEKFIITSVSIALTIIFNNLGIVGYLPLIAIVAYNIFMTTKNIYLFKSLIIFTMVMWAIYDFTIKSYTSFAFDIFTLIANIISIYNIKNKPKKKR